MAAPRTGPTKPIVVSEEDIAKAERMAGIGLTKAKIALVLGMSLASLKRYRKANAALEEAIARGLAKTELKVGSHLMKRIEAGDMRAIRWWEMTRVGHTVKVAHSTLPVAVEDMSDEELERLSAGEAPETVLRRGRQ